MKKLLFVLTFSLSLFANNNLYIDSDLDGVIDIYDKCLNTSFEDEVDRYGCAINSTSDLKKRITLGYERHQHKNETYNYDYNLKRLEVYLENDKYLFGISQDYTKINYLYKPTQTSYDIKGYGDLSLELGYYVKYKCLESINLIANLSTSNNDNLTSGKNDYTLEFNFQESFDNTTLFSTIAYNYTGNTDISYKNYFDYQLGFVRYNYGIYYGINIYYSEPILDGSNELISIQPNLSIPFGNNYQFSFSYSENLNRRDQNNRKSTSFKLSYGF